jgi:tetratricopeptide (TPR) repeat protein
MPAGFTDLASSGWKAHLGVAQAALRLGRAEEAVGAAQQAWRHGGRTAQTLEAVEKAVDEVLARDPARADLHRLQAEARAAEGDLDGALGSVRRALVLDPSDPESLAAAGAVLFALGAIHESEQAYGEALARRPGWARAQVGLEEARRALLGAASATTTYPA